MATITRVTGDMTTGDVKTGAEIRIRVWPPGSAAVPVDPDNPTVAERLFVETRMPIFDNDVPNGVKVAEWKHLDDATWATMAPSRLNPRLLYWK